MSISFLDILIGGHTTSHILYISWIEVILWTFDEIIWIRFIINMNDDVDSFTEPLFMRAIIPSVFDATWTSMCQGLEHLHLKYQYPNAKTTQAGSKQCAFCLSDPLLAIFNETLRIYWHLLIISHLIYRCKWTRYINKHADE